MDTSLSRPDRRMLVAGSALGAAAIHLAMVPAHAAEWLPLALAFAASAWAQGLLGVAVLVRRRVADGHLLALVTGACIAAWAVSRTVGLPVGPDAWSPEAVSSVDLLCVALEVVTLAALLVPARARTSRPVGGWLGAGSVAAVALLTTAVLASPTAAEHGHEHTDTVALGAHVHGVVGAPSTTGAAPATHDHVAAAGSTSTPADATDAADGHVHADASSSSAATGTSAVHDHGAAAAATSATAAPGGHDHGAPVAGAPPSLGVTSPHHHAECTAPITPDQQAAADRLASDTLANLARWADVKDAEADGFVPITPAGVLMHYGNKAWMVDGHNADPTRPESLVYAFPKQGGPILLGAMFLAEPGAPGPQVGGCATVWHDHTNLCLADKGGAMVGVTDADGQCPQGSHNRVTSEMLHVWDLPLAGGPFSEATPQQLRDGVIAKMQAAR